MPELVYDNKAIQKLERVGRDREWLNQNYDKIKEQFNEMYVAIKDQEIVDHDRNLNCLLVRITSKYAKNSRSVVIEHMTDERPVYVL